MPFFWLNNYHLLQTLLYGTFIVPSNDSLFRHHTRASCSTFFIDLEVLLSNPFLLFPYIASLLAPFPLSLHPTTSNNSSQLTSTNLRVFSFLNNTTIILLRQVRSTSRPHSNMPSFKSVLSASALAFLASTNAHMIMLTPPPYGTPNSSPLDAQGADFPCKSATSSGGTVTDMAIGQKQTLSFKGSAVHGGGSCQVSLTTDNPATKDSKWMVIHSIVGGCPARSSGGNLPENPNGSGADKYDFAIPQGIAPGAYTLAWTWFNKVGNREMYMNCASIKVTGGTSKRETAANETEEYSIPQLSERATPNFPAMFVANIPASNCVTAEGGSVEFPDPGTSVETNSGPFQKPTGPKCQAAGAQQAAAPASGSSSSASGSAAPSGAASSGSGSGSSSGAPDSKAAAPPVAAPVASAAAPSPAVANGSAPAAASAKPSTPAAPAAAGSSTGSCTQPGQSICSPDGKQIGTCTSSNTVTWIPVASGTKCSGGLMVMAGSKRSAKFRLL